MVKLKHFVFMQFMLVLLWLHRNIEFFIKLEWIISTLYFLYNDSIMSVLGSMLFILSDLNVTLFCPLGIPVCLVFCPGSSQANRTWRNQNFPMVPGLIFTDLNSLELRLDFMKNWLIKGLISVGFAFSVVSAMAPSMSFDTKWVQNETGSAGQ